jgi:transposase InsO family protein
MVRLGLKARYPKRFKVTTDSNHSETISPNSLARQFDVFAPNQVWTTDITYVWTLEGWLYLAVVIDLFSRQVVGWSIADPMRTSLCVSALQMAFLSRGHKGAESRSLACSIIQIEVANRPAMTTVNIWLL